MNKKYFETKTGSIEEKITKIATEQQSIVKQEPNVKLERKTYFENKPGSIGDIVNRVISESFIKENTYAFDYNFELYMPSTSQRGDGDAIKEYEGTIKASGKDAGEAKPKAEKELQRRIDAAEKATKGTLETENLGSGRAVSEGMDPVNKDAVKKKFDDRKDKDIDNDGDTDSTDKYLHKRRAAISKATSEAISPAQQAAIAISKKEKGEKPKNEEKVECSKCEGEGCSHCKDKGYHMEQICSKCGKDHANKINSSNCMGESKKSFSDLRTETKVIKLGDKGKTATGKEAGAVDVEPRAIPV